MIFREKSSPEAYFFSKSYSFSQMADIYKYKSLGYIINLHIQG